MPLYSEFHLPRKKVEECLREIKVQKISNLRRSNCKPRQSYGKKSSRKLASLRVRRPCKINKDWVPTSQPSTPRSHLPKRITGSTRRNDSFSVNE